MPFGEEIYALLAMADEHGANHLRAACMEGLLSYGQHLLLGGPALSALPPPLLVELLVSAASRRAPPLPPPVPTGAFAVPIEITSDEEPPAAAKRKAKRKTDGEPRRDEEVGEPRRVATRGAAAAAPRQRA